MLKIIYPPRPKGKMLPSDLPFYEKSGKWCAQRKFKGSRTLLYISADRKLTMASRHGRSHSKFELDRKYREEILSGLRLKPGLDYWLDGELMNKEVNATNEIIFYDVLHVGRYLFNSPSQVERLGILNEICGEPSTLEPGGIALAVTPRVWMAQTFFSDFEARFQEALPVPRLEGLVLRRRDEGLDHFGNVEYETGNLIRCRKSFAKDKGYEF